MSIILNNSVDLQSTRRIIGASDPITPDEVANKSYVDAQIAALAEGLAWKDDARVATSANINLAAPGASIDGVTLAIDDRVLLIGQTLDEQNGIYIFNGAASPLTRSPDADTGESLEAAILAVAEGTSAGVVYRQTQANITIDVDPIAFTVFPTGVPVATETISGTVKLATQAEVDAGVVADEAVTPATLNAWSGRKLKHTQLVGDGVNTSYTVTHNLGTEDLGVFVRKVSNGILYIPDATTSGSNAVIVTFAVAPTLNEFAITILA